MDLEDILKQLYPDANQKNCLSGIVSTMGNILINSSSILRIKKVTPAGSLSRNTILRNHLEVDCVYILEHNGLSFYHNFSEVQRALKDNLPKETEFKIGKHSISFELERRIGTVSVDLLPAFEINDPSQIMQVKNGDAYYGSTSLIQKKYFKKVVKKYARFTDLVRLLKLWRNTRDFDFLTSYMVELLVSYAIYYTPEDQEFPFFLETCFRTIQAFTDERRIEPVYWDKNYNNLNINWNYSKNDLWLIDPSDPSENLGEKIPENKIDHLRSEAAKGINYIHIKEYSFLFK